MKVSSSSIFSFIEALMVVSVWSATPPLAKIVMGHLSPLSFLAVRYSIGTLTLLPFLFGDTREILKKLSMSAWARLVFMGIITYVIANGLQFWALTRLPATTGTFTMNFVSLFTLGLGAVFLAEKPTFIQWLGVIIAIAGTLVFFGVDMQAGDFLAILASSLGSLVLAINAVMARRFASSGEINSVGLAAIPLGAGSLTLLVMSPPTNFPPPEIILILLFLGTVACALAYTVWSHALKNLQAFEITFVQNLMPMGTAIIAPLILGEVVSHRAWIGILVTLLGITLVGLRVRLRRG